MLTVTSLPGRRVSYYSLATHPRLLVIAYLDEDALAGRRAEGWLTRDDLVGLGLGLVQGHS